MGLTTAEIQTLESIQTNLESIREEHARKRRERGKAVWPALPSEPKWEQD